MSIVVLPNVDETCQPVIIGALETFVDSLGADLCVITSAFREGDPGQHGKGLAVDVIFPNSRYSLAQLYSEATESGLFKGIGVYPDWEYGGEKVGGLHLDCREGGPARWLGIGRGQGGGPNHGNTYLPLTDENLKKYGVT